MRFSIFIATFMTLLGLVYSFVGLRVLSTLPSLQRYKGTFWIGLGFLWLLQIISPVVYRSHITDYPFWVKWMQWGSYFSLGLFVLLFFSFVFLEPLRIFLTLNTGFDPEKRNFLLGATSALTLGAPTFMSLLGLREAIKPPTVVPVDISFSGLPETWTDFKIAQISDLHIGPTLRKNFLDGVVAQVNALEPDVIAITGDLVDGTVDQICEQVAPLSQLRAKHEVYFITGNHEYYWDAPSWITALKQMGIRVLLNENEILDHQGGKLLLAGVTDLHAETFFPEQKSSPEKAIQSSQKANVKVLLAHQPGSCDEAQEAGFDLQLSGHTHGGQFWPFRMLVNMVHPYIRGLHKHKDKMWIYVNKGTGYWGPPLRIGSESEISLIHIKRA